MFDAKWLVAAHLQGRDATVTIESVRAGEIVGEAGRRDRMPIVKLRGKELPLGLNKTNCKTISAMYGNDTAAWVGKQITLFPTTCKAKEGGIVDCIRVRPSIPIPAGATKTPDPEQDGR